MADLLTIESVAHWLNVSTKTIERYTRDGTLREVDGMYDRADIETFLDSRRT